MADPYVISSVTSDHAVEVTFATDAAPSDTWYLPGDCTQGGMETWVPVQNPNPDPVTVDLTFMTGLAPWVVPQDFPITANSQVSLNAGLFVTDWDVSTKVKSKKEGAWCRSGPCTVPEGNGPMIRSGIRPD
ncbi:MAG: hypothetical protein HPY75_05830 [Actinobacteria bacterium]|nr:hypothetical protein [Actinomycetota bacterium]